MTTPNIIKQYDQVLYLLQGGGALGAYQVGVCEALLDRHCVPNWVIGTSIGGINAAIIAGNKPENRVPMLKKFWGTIAIDSPSFMPDFLSGMFGDQMRRMENMYFSDWAAMFGINGFFKPRIVNPWLDRHSSPDKLSFYDTSDLQKTLEAVIDFNILNAQEIRLTVSAVCVETGAVVRFDNTKQTIYPHHIMATAALPPGFPAIKIDNKYYWDGGLNSNTPFEVLLEEPLNENVLGFVVNLFAIVDKAPSSMSQILKRKKDLEFISQHHTLLHYFCELQEYRRSLEQLLSLVPNPEKYPELQKLANSEHVKTLNLARFHYQDEPYESWAKDFEFSQKSLVERFKHGYDDVRRAFEDPSWLDLIPNQIQLHNF